MGGGLFHREDGGDAQRLLAIVGHELRAPMAAISVAAASLGARESLTESEARSVALIQRSTQRMGRMVQQLLDLACVQTGGWSLEREPIDLAQIIADQLAEAEAAHPDRVLVLRVTGSTRGHWDGTRLSEVVSNLLSNAIQYGDPATPVSLAIDGESDPVKLSVHNTGPPIPKEALPFIFDPFRRAHSTTTHTRRGAVTNLGLGLYIANEIVTAHGGTIGVCSSAAAGTTFHVHLPRGGPLAKASQGEPGDPAPRGRGRDSR
jgi:signal transduction histidine kinase